MSRPRLPDGELTERELEVEALKVQRLSNAAIARKLVVEVGTVKAHVHNIYKKKVLKEKLYGALLLDRLRKVCSR